MLIGSEMVSAIDDRVLFSGVPVGHEGSDKREEVVFLDYLVRVALHGVVLAPELKLPSMVLPLTRPLYLALPTLKLIRSPVSLPSRMDMLLGPDLNVPENF